MMYELILISTGVVAAIGAIQGVFWAALVGGDALREAVLWAKVGAVVGLGLGALASAFVALGGGTLGV